jgi:hypothetical protein
MTFAAADMTGRASPAPGREERDADLLERMALFAEEAARTASAAEEEAAEQARSVIGFVVLTLLQAAGRLVVLSFRVFSGRGFPKPRERRTDAAQRAQADGEQDGEPPRRPSAPGRIRFADLVALGVPGAEALRARLADLLADPEMAELVSAEPAAWRAAAPLARAFGLPLPPRPVLPEPVPRQPVPGAGAPPGAPAKPSGEPAKPPPGGWFRYEAGLRPPVPPFARPKPASDPPPPRLGPGGPPAASLRTRLLRSALGRA